MKKRFLILVLIFAALLCVCIYLFSTINSEKGKIPQHDPTVTGLPYVTSAPMARMSPSPDTFLISGVPVASFFNPADLDPRYHDVNVSKSQNYNIIYNENDSSIQLSILVSPFLEVQKQAEAELMDLLKISREDACKLKIIVTTPFFANPDYSGWTHRLSFCR